MPARLAARTSCTTRTSPEVQQHLQDPPHNLEHTMAPRTPNAPTRTRVRNPLPLPEVEPTHVPVDDPVSRFVAFRVANMRTPYTAEYRDERERLGWDALEHLETLHPDTPTGVLVSRLQRLACAAEDAEDARRGVL